MKYLLMTILTILCLNTAYGEKMVTLPESELKQYLDQLEKDDTTIKALQAENYKMKLEIMELKVDVDTWKYRDDKQMGFYLGGAVGYPLPSLEAIGLYKFRKWGLYASGGYYGKSPAINFGAMVKTK